MTRWALPLPLLLLLAGCALERWTLPQPMIQTTDVDTLWTRAREAVTQQCAGIEAENTFSQVLMGHWQAWSSPDGVYLTRCMLTVLPEDKTSATVRLTFTARACGTASLDDPDELAKHCPEAESVPQIVKDQLEILTGHVEATVKREPPVAR